MPITERPAPSVAPAPAGPAFIDLRAVETADRGLSRTGAPVTCGVPLPRGRAHSAAGWTLKTSNGASLPIQARVLARWPDGSIRWALLDTQVSTTSGAPVDLRLRLDGAGPDRQEPLVRPCESGLEVDTGAARFTLSTAAPLFFTDVAAGGLSILDAGRCALRIADGDGAWPVRWHALTLEENGPVRASVRLDGDARAGRATGVHLTARLHFFRGLSAVRLRLTVHNPRRAAHPGGFWELGDRGSRLLQELAIVLRRSRAWAATGIEWSIAPDHPLDRTSARLEIYQGSSGGEHWMSTNHVNRHGVVPNRFPGYRVSADGRLTDGRRATPVVRIDGGGPALGAAVPHFWQNFPSALTVSADEVTVGFFPSQYGDLHELQGGEQKTHECYLAFGPDRVTDLPLDWCRSPLVASPSPDWYAAAGAAPHLTPAARDPHADYLALVGSAIDGDDSFERKRERIDEYGWRHFGDIYGDHEAVGHTGPAPLVSHYNNQYDAVAGMACQFMRTRDPRWWTACLELAAHVTDIDLYHTTDDKAAYNGGLFWHTVHYVDAGRSTHRSYPRAAGSTGGGPASEQNYTTGLRLHYFMTGDPLTRGAVMTLARFVLDMDDGRLTMFRWLARGETGLASASRTPLYHGPGRGSGNSLNALLDGHLLTGERRYLDKAEEIIRRCVHPHQPLEPLGLLDRENRWFYTMFLEALARYLVHKQELNEGDAMYAYARGTLLHYARWMAVHESPYLDRPADLEFPTETWAAQDLRKSDVFAYAAMHAVGAERARFVERAAAYFHYATSTLMKMPTRTLARPVVILLTHGFPHTYLERHPAAAMPLPARPPRPAAWEAATPSLEVPVVAPPPFEPQKVRARRRAAYLAVLSALAGLMMLGLAFGSGWR